MASYSRQILYNSVDGKPIPITAVATTGTLIHTAGYPGAGSPNAVDEVWAWASNVTGSPATLTVEFGGTTAPDNHLVNSFAIAAHSAPIPIITGQVITNNHEITAFSNTSGAINITGYVNRIL